MGPGARRSRGQSRHREPLEEQDRNNPSVLVREGDDQGSWKSAEAYESGLDEINGRLRATAAELAVREAFVSRNRDRRP